MCVFFSFSYKCHYSYEHNVPMIENTHSATYINMFFNLVFEPIVRGSRKIENDRQTILEWVFEPVCVTQCVRIAPASTACRRPHSRPWPASFCNSTKKKQGHI